MEATKGITVLSLFDGMSIGRLALQEAGIKVDRYYSSDIKPAALRVASTNHPYDDEYRLGDITAIKADTLPRIDLLIGGSPCQNLSGANKERLGLAGEKSGLFYEYLRLLQECKPTYFLLENVKMEKSQEDIISNLLGVKPIRINSQLVSAQLRDRLYWTNIPQLHPIQPKDIELNSILISGYSDRTKARALLESDSRPLSTPIKMVHRYFNTGFTTLIFKSKEHYDAIVEHFREHFKGQSAKYIEEVSKDMDMSIYDGVRYLFQVERERLQTVPDGYTECLTSNEAASVLGDGWTVDVIAHLLKGINNGTTTI